MELQRDIGRHEALIETHAARLANIEEKLDKVLSALHQAKGGWKTLVAAGATAGAIGTFLMDYIIGRH